MEKNYTEKDIEAIKKQAMEEQRQKDFLRYAEKTLSNNLITKEKKNPFSIKFTAENVKKYLENPMTYEKELRELSTVLTTLSPQYQQIINYFPSISKFIPIIYPNIEKYSDGNNKEKLKKDYIKAVCLVEKMNIEYEFQKIMTVCTRDDVFYGYVHETNDGFYIQQMDSDYCKISSVVDGVFCYMFNFAYFDKIKEIKNIEGRVIDSYPQEFKTKYALYESNKSTYKWQELDYNNTICIKMLSELPFVFPTFCSLFDDLADLSKYKELNKNKTQIDNYKFIGMQLPTSTKGGNVDDFLVSPDTALAFYNMMLSMLPEGIGAFLSATPFEAINFNSSATKESDNVNNAENNVFTASGAAAANFGKGASSSTALKSSNLVDSARMFKIYRQFEKWLNLRLKKKLANKFRGKILDVTVFTIQDEIDKNLKLSQYGIPNKIRLAALLGMSQSEQLAMNILEEDILQLTEVWKPLVSSHVQSGSTSSSEDTGNEPTSDAAEVTIDRDDNIDKN